MPKPLQKTAQNDRMESSPEVILSGHAVCDMLCSGAADSRSISLARMTVRLIDT